MIGHLYMVTISIVNIFQEVSFFSSTSFEHVQSPQSRSPQVGATSIKKKSFKTLDEQVDKEVQKKCM